MAEVNFFEASSPAGLVNATDWEPQSGPSPTISRQRAQALKANGDELAFKQYGAQKAFTFNYKAKRVSGAALEIPPVGKVVSGYHVDSVTLTYSQTDFPALAVTAHKHCADDGTEQTHDPTRYYECDIDCPALPIGVPELEGVFTLPDGLGMRSLTVTLACNHVDEMDGTGGHLAGDNYDGSETVAAEMTGSCTVGELSIGDGWGLPESHGTAQSNTGVTTTSFSLVKHLQGTEPSPAAA